MTRSPVGLIRQGDVLLRPRTTPVPAEAAPVPRDAGRVILAYGEVTGHAHALRGDGTTLLTAPGQRDRVLMLAGDDALLHEEHTILDIPAVPCGYDVIQQRQELYGRSVRVED